MKRAVSEQPLSELGHPCFTRQSLTIVQFGFTVWSGEGLEIVVREERTHHAFAFLESIAQGDRKNSMR